MVRIFCDSAGVTHFEDGYILLSGAGAIGSLSDALEGATVRFRENGSDYQYDWHPTPARQFICLMSGAIEVEVGDGERRTLVAGQTLFLEDTEPPGHRTRNVGDTPRWSVFIQTDAPVPYLPES